MDDKPHTIDVQLTKRELTLIRVSCMMRLTALKERGLDQSPVNSQSYQEIRELLNGKLWFAVTILREKEPGI